MTMTTKPAHLRSAPPCFEVSRLAMRAISAHGYDLNDETGSVLRAFHFEKRWFDGPVDDNERIQLYAAITTVLERCKHLVRSAPYPSERKRAESFVAALTDLAGRIERGDV